MREQIYTDKSLQQTLTILKPRAEQMQLEEV